MNYRCRCLAIQDAGMGASIARSWEGRSSTVMHVFVVLQPLKAPGGFPQGLKPRVFFGSNGTAEAVPFPSNLRAGNPWISGSTRKVETPTLSQKAREGWGIQIPPGAKARVLFRI
jgi:hypothetical protein